MDLFEYQAKTLFRDNGVPTGLGEVAVTPAEAKEIAERIGGVTVVKAQVKVGGRGKAGGVKVAKTPADAEQAAEAILGMDIKGHTVHRVLVDPGAQIEREYYVSYLLDRTNRTFLAMASAEGGMEIEQLAVERPDALARVPIDALTGVDMAKAREIVAAANFPSPAAEAVAEVLAMARHVAPFGYSLGFDVTTDGGSNGGGRITNLHWNSPAFKAGLTGRMTIIAVDGRSYTPELLRDAIKSNRDGQHPIELIVRSGDYFRTVAIDYRDGLRYPHLARIDGTPDRLSAIFMAK